jgi:hypothetical protein
MIDAMAAGNAPASHVATRMCLHHEEMCLHHEEPRRALGRAERGQSPIESRDDSATPRVAASRSLEGPLLAERALRRLGVDGAADSYPSFVALLDRRAGRRLTDNFGEPAGSSFVVTLAGRATGIGRTLAREPADG